MLGRSERLASARTDTRADLSSAPRSGIPDRTRRRRHLPWDRSARMDRARRSRGSWRAGRRAGELHEHARRGDCRPADIGAGRRSRWRPALRPDLQRRNGPTRPGSGQHAGRQRSGCGRHRDRTLPSKFRSTPRHRSHRHLRRCPRDQHRRAHPAARHDGNACPRRAAEDRRCAQRRVQHSWHRRRRSGTAGVRQPQCHGARRCRQSLSAPASGG